MNAPLSYRERRALQLHTGINEDVERDPFDADYCPTEAPETVADRDSETFRPARPPVVPAVDRTECRKKLAAAKALIKNTEVPHVDDTGRTALRTIICWHNTPELYRKHLARLAGLGPDVVPKLDRDLTETEKAMLRSAARDLRECCASLVNL